MNREFAILFLGGAKRVSLAEYLIEAGKRRGLDIRIYSYELNKEVPIACIGEVIIGKRWKDPQLDTHLSEVIREKQIRMILPFVDPAIEVASRLKELHSEVFIPCSDIELCRVMFDKVQSDQWFAEHGIPVPVSYGIKDEMRFPVILKPRTGSASKGIRVVNDRKEYEEVPDKENYLIQDYISDNEEYTVDCYVAQDGEALAIVPRIRLEVAGGEVTSTRILRDETLITLSRNILSSGRFRGPITIQYIRDCRTGATYVMEINPRLGGGVIAALAAGADMPSFLLAECFGEHPQPIEDWKENTLMTRYFKEVIFYADHH